MTSVFNFFPDKTNILYKKKEASYTPSYQIKRLKEMSSKIRLLDEQTINKIAAGEVIENPASVVKELVENSLDAESTEICVEIVSGGRQLIRISDNGCGMNRDDALLCLERHATSKLKSIDDIHALLTMGFRGEAIPSIASISKFTLLTCPHKEEAEGTMLIVEGGKLLKVCSTIRAPGTTIEVKSLFFNVPVRKKFQRSPVYDSTEILKILSKIALANPKVKIELISNQNTLLCTQPEPSQEERAQLEHCVEKVLGSEFLESCCYAEAEQEECTLRGFIGLPSHMRHNRTGQYLFINRRPVYSNTIASAIREGYGTTLPVGRHPIYLLHLTIPGDLVDVNVHPQKREVRLRQEQNLKRLICQAIDGALHAKGVFSPGFTEWNTCAPEFSVDHSPTISESISEKKPAFYSPFKQQLASHQAYTFVEESHPTPPSAIEPPPFWTHAQENEAPPSNPEPAPSLFTEVMKSQKMPKVLGTIQRFILLESASIEDHGEGLCLIDQRAAHCRIIFEKLLKQEKNAPLEIQQLLIPYMLQLTPLESATLCDLLPELHAIGIDIKEFGPNTFIIEGIPQIFGTIDVQAFIHDTLRALQQESGNHSVKQEREKQIALIASRIAVSTKSKLSMEEAQKLTEDLFKCQQPKLCPSGKPTMVHMPSEMLAKYFN